MLTEKQTNIIRGKMMVGGASVEEQREFLTYVNELELLAELADEYDTFGTEGWRHRIGWDD